MDLLSKDSLVYTYSGCLEPQTIQSNLDKRSELTQLVLFLRLYSDSQQEKLACVKL